MTISNLPRDREGIVIGKIAGAYGVKGAVKIAPFCEDLSLLEKAGNLRISILRMQGEHVVAEIEGVANREDAHALKGTEIYVQRSVMIDPDDGEYYHEDLKGLEVKDATTGKSCGRVIAVQDFGAVPLLEISPLSGSSYYLPFTLECVPEVNVAKGFVSVSIPDGLLDR